MVVNFNVNFPVGCERLEGNRGISVGELERVLDQVGESRLHQRAVRQDAEGRVHGEHRQRATACSRLEMRCALSVGNERAHGKHLALHAVPMPYLLDRSIDENVEGVQAALEHRTGGAAHVHVPELKGTHGKPGRRQCVSQFMHEEANLLLDILALTFEQPRVAQGAELENRVCNRVVQAAVQCPEFGHGERGVALECQVSDGLTEVAVVMDDLVDRVPHLQKARTVGCRADAHLR